MNLKNHFDISRFWLLLRMELFRSKKGLLMIFVILIGLLFFAGLLLDCVIEKKAVYDSHPFNYAFTLIIVGFILSSLAFNDLSSTLKRYHYLMLPASTFEKFLSMWLLTSVGWIVVFTTIYTLYTVAANAFGPVLFRSMTFLPFDPFSEFSINVMRSYFVLHGIFLAGAAYFKGYVFPKTLFALIVFITACATMAYFIMGDEFINHDCGEGKCELLHAMIEHRVATFAQWLFWWVLAPMCWVNTYVGLKEQEV